MKLLKIGHDASCDIVLHSNKVSSLHAEITLLNSGDILLEDKGSLNGTFIMNQPIKPGKPVNIRRGDAVRFADVELQWSQIPMPEDNSAFKAIYGIGSNFNNDIQISGATVSRYHATIKVGKDGKTYIVDHSKNGTTVDGVRIPKDSLYRIKKSSAVVCGGVPVDLTHRKDIFSGGGAGKTIGLIAAGIVLLAGITFGLMKLLGSGAPDIDALKRATVQVYEQYYIEVQFEDDPFVGKIDKWPSKWYIGVSDNSLAMGTPGEDIKPISGNGTAFFISEKGELGTNRHIAVPWEYISEQWTEDIRQLIQKTISTRNTVLVNLLNRAIAYGAVDAEDAQAWFDRLSRSKYTISGNFDYIGIALYGTTFSTIADLKACQVIAESKDIRKDVALLRLNEPKTPKEIIDRGFFDINKARVDESSLKATEKVCSIGFPMENNTGLAFVSDGKELLPVVHNYSISKNPDNEMFQLQGNIVGGQSGSPIIDENRKLIGVLFAGWRTTDVSYGCNIKHLKELYDKNKYRE